MGGTAPHFFGIRCHSIDFSDAALRIHLVTLSYGAHLWGSHDIMDGNRECEIDFSVSLPP